MKSKKTVEQKIKEEMPEFLEAVIGLSVDDLNAKLAALAKDYEGVVQWQENDVELAQSREKVKEFNGPYVDAKRTIRLKNKYLVSLVIEKGGK